MRGDLFGWLDALGMVTLRFDAEGRLAYGNPAAMEMLNGRVELGAPWEALLASVAPALPDRIRTAVPGAVRADGHWRGQVMLTDPSGHGELYHAMVSPDPPPDEDGFLVVFRSLAESRRREQAERELEARDEFVARLGHELRTPLNAVLGFAQLLELEELPPDPRRRRAHPDRRSPHAGAAR